MNNETGSAFNGMYCVPEGRCFCEHWYTPKGSDLQQIVNSEQLGACFRGKGAGLQLPLARSALAARRQPRLDASHLKSITMQIKPA